MGPGAGRDGEELFEAIESARRRGASCDRLGSQFYAALVGAGYEKRFLVASASLGLTPEQVPFAPLRAACPRKAPFQTLNPLERQVASQFAALRTSFRRPSLRR